MMFCFASSNIHLIPRDSKPALNIFAVRATLFPKTNAPTSDDVLWPVLQEAHSS
jgi:hypothetical protein